ncbi:MAG: spondin domain-containing protein [Candidatus Eisenbacteria bacterium]
MLLMMMTVASALADPAGTMTYRITVENLTPARGGGASQVLSPSLVLLHDGRANLFTVGQRANQSVIDVAEDAIGSTGIAAYNGDNGVGFVGFLGSPILPGQSQSFEVSAPARFHQLSLASMLVNTNDAFTGLDAVQLTGGSNVYMTQAYDAGSEVNDQLRANIPGPCCGDTGRHGTDESEVIRHHLGILPGVGDLVPETWGWPTGSAVARITVERVK